MISILPRTLYRWRNESEESMSDCGNCGAKLKNEIDMDDFRKLSEINSQLQIEQNLVNWIRDCTKAEAELTIQVKIAEANRAMYETIFKERDRWKASAEKLAFWMEDVASHVCHPDCNHQDVARAALAAYARERGTEK